MKYFSILFLFILASCSTIDTNVFKTYNENVSSSVSSLEKNMQKISGLGEELFAIEASLNRQDMIDLQYTRASAYDVILLKEPFFFAVVNASQSIQRFNTFLISYSNTLLSIASNDFSSAEAIITFNNSLKGISNELDINNDVVDYSISSSAVLIKNIADRLSHRARISYLQNISSSSNEIILQMLDRYIELIDNLEVVMFDYYYRTFNALENVMFEEENFYERRELSRELVNLSEEYRRNVSGISSMRNKFVSLKETQAQLHDMIMNKDFDEETVTDFIIQNYEFYEELE